MGKIKEYLKKKLVRVQKEKVVISCIEGSYLKGKCAFITGGSSGIGFSIAEAFIKNGAKVIITGRDKNKLIIAKRKLKEKCLCDENKIIIETLDISLIDNLEKNVKDIINECDQKIDILVNNAGINGGESFPITNEKDFDKIVDINLKGTYFISQIFVNYMIENKIEGNILNITSSSALRPAISPYMISKWGEKGLTLGMAKKCLQYGIVVNGIAPGTTATSMLNKEETDDLFCPYTLTNRYIAPEEIGNWATLLVSDMGRMIIGDTIYITGGAGVITYDDMKY